MQTWLFDNKKQMHLSYSEDILQRIRAQQSLNNTMRSFMTPKNPENFHSTLFWSKNNDKSNPSRTPQAALSPLLQRPIFYNELINEEQIRVRGRYRVRNYRQHRAHKNETASKYEGSRWVSTSYSGLKEIMRQEMDKGSVKKSYDNIIEKGDHEVVEKLKSQLLFLPNSVKIPHRNRYRPNKRLSCNPANKIVINGNKLEEKSKPETIKLNKEIEFQNFPDANKRTAGYELKYRRNYLDKKVEKANKEPKPSRNEEEQPLQMDPLTGWS